LNTKNTLIAACLLAVTSTVTSSIAIAAPIKVAFIGDQGIGGNSLAVLTLIANEGTDLLMIQGDLGYAENAANDWNKNLTSALGSDFPVLAVVGNHENFEWPKYKGYIQRRIDQNDNLNCSGDTGVKAHCNFGNIDIVQVAQGVNEVEGVKPYDDYEEYIRSSFSSSEHQWRICSWHKTQRDMQAGRKVNSTGWEIYDACLDAGAMIGMAHAHTYSRTHLLSDFEQKTIVSTSSDMTLKPGQSFAFVSGLGGRDVIPQDHSGDWFASIYTASQGATHGALFCTFDVSTADCYFKAIDGAIPDRFTLNLDAVQNQSKLKLAAAPPISAPTPAVVSLPSPGYVFSRSDKAEFLWIDSDSSGTPASVWISESCAAQMGGPSVTGNWKALADIGASSNTIENPCPQAATLALKSDLESPPEHGYVFSRNNKTESHWIDLDAAGNLGSVWISESCAAQMGGPSATGDWKALTGIGAALNTIESPCAASESSTRERPNDIGYVYSRTDKNEFRWIARNNSGVWGSIWINLECANRLGGAKAKGDWFELMDEAPGFDTIPNPCS